MALIQESFTFGSAGSVDRTFTNPVAAGSLLIALIIGDSARNLSSVTDTLGNTWVPGVYAENTAAAADRSLSIWYCVGSAGGPCTVTLTAPVTFPNTWYYVAEFDAVSAFDTSDTNSLSLDTTAGTQPFPYGVSGSQTAAGLMIALMSNDPPASSFSTPTGFTMTGLITSGNRVYYRYSTSAIAYSTVITDAQSSSVGNLHAAMGILSFLVTAIPPDDSSICGCEPADTGVVQDGGTPDAGGDPWIQPVIGSPALVCVGGGLVPIQADLVHSEQWWGR
jgi:hypothetical protein